jgi:hypothetical protein
MGLCPSKGVEGSTLVLLPSAFLHVRMQHQNAILETERSSHQTLNLPESDLGLLSL